MFDLTVSQLFHSFSSDDDKIIRSKLGAALCQNMPYFPFDSVTCHSISQFFTDRQTHPKVLLVLAGEIDVLVSTTVIEVGIDVANATVMFIREAECFGMSQLHQLRGRVGRGGNMSTCFFHYLAQEGSPTEQRITQMANTTDGFEVAELDLANRREGNVLGADQSGRSEKLQFLNLLDHGDVIELANKDATRIIEQDITLARSLVSRYDERSQEFIDKT